MKGRMRCRDCGHEFDIKHAGFTFDMAVKDEIPGKMTCPRCDGENLEPA